MNKKTSSLLHPQTIEEDDFLIDYYRFGSIINALSGVANYQKYNSLKDIYDKRAIFVAQQALFLGSLEDLALFLNALHDGGRKGATVLHSLAESKKAKSDFPRILDNFKDPMKLLSWLNLSRDNLIELIREKFKIQKREAKKWLDSRISEIREDCASLRIIKLNRNKAYNKTKHGKPIISISAPKINSMEQATDADGPSFYYIEKNPQPGEPILRSHIIPFSDKEFDNITRVIISSSEVTRDLIILFVLEFHPNAFERIKNLESKTESLRRMVPKLFK